MKKRLIAYPIIFFVLYSIFMTAMTFKIFNPPVKIKASALNFFDERNSENIFLKTTDGVDISALYAARGGEKAFICLHGFGTGKYDIEDAAVKFYLNGYSVLLISFRNHDNSQKAYTTLGGKEIFDIKAGYDFLRQTGYEKIYGWGVSMGASSLILAAAEENTNFSAIITESPYYSFEKVVKRYGEIFLGFPPWLHYAAVSNIYRLITGVNPRKIDLGEAARKINGKETPVFVYAAQNDIQVPPEEVKKIYDLLNVKKKFVLVKNAGHVECRFKYGGYFNEIFEFINE